MRVYPNYYKKLHNYITIFSTIKDLIAALREPKPATPKPKTPKPRPKLEIRVTKRKLKQIRKDFDELRHEFE